MLRIAHLLVCPILSGLCLGAAAEDPLRIENVELACTGSPLLSGPWLCFQVNEADQGGADLDGDGDATDTVYFVRDTRTGETRNLGVTLGIGTVISAHHAVFALVAHEAAASEDLNGDGDLDDPVLVVYDAETDRLLETGFALTVDRPFVFGDRVHFMVRESRQGGTDLNGDGDAEDDVAFWLDIDSGAVHNAGLTTYRDPVPFGDWLAIRVTEKNQGPTDLNGDGDETDEVVHVVDLVTGLVTNLGMSSNGELRADSHLLVFGASEYGDRTDYDGDGNIEYEGVVHVHDVLNGQTHNVGVSVTFWVASPQIEGLVFFGDSSDPYSQYPVLALEANTGVLRPTGITTQQPLVAWETFVGAPPQQTSDPFLVADVLTGETRSLSSSRFFAKFEDGLLTTHYGNPTGSFWAYDPLLDEEWALGVPTSAGSHASDRDGHRASWVVVENYADLDLNGDGDTMDQILKVYDRCTGQTFTIELAAMGFNPRQHSFERGRLAFLVPEERQGGTDLNGDGDTDDTVLHLARFFLPEPHESSYGDGLPGWQNRVPRLDALGCAAPERSFSVQVRKARPSALGVLVLGLDAAELPLLGGTLHVAPPFLGVVPFVLPDLCGEGIQRLDLGVIPPALAGETLFLQAGIEDPAAPQGFSLSQGRQVDFPVTGS